jgi:hypothetical protein
MTYPNFSVSKEMERLDEPSIVATTPLNVSPSIPYNIGYTIVNTRITTISITMSMQKTGGGGAVLSFTIPEYYCASSNDQRGGTMVYVSGGLYKPGTFRLVQSTDPVRIEFFDVAGATLADNDIVTRQNISIYAI